MRLYRSLVTLLEAFTEYVAHAADEWVANVRGRDEMLPKAKMRVRLQAVMQQEQQGFPAIEPPENVVVSMGWWLAAGNVCRACGGSWIDHGEWVECDTCGWNNEAG